MRPEFPETLNLAETSWDLMLQEEQHRTANELASALAALRLALRRGPAARMHLETAVERLEGFASVRRLLCNPERKGCDIAGLLEDMSRSIVRGRDMPGPCRYVVPARPVHVLPGLARTILLVAHEMTINALKHSDTSDPVVLTMHAKEDRIELRCSNGTSGGNPVVGTSRGLQIMKAACAELGGRFEYERRGGRFQARAILPRLPRPAV
ncbi:sensor histidine kinase family protein [Qipengyuania citrea]|jgi:two-component sensor histidine kinase|uniref:sensor histidine kinase n=1 Tax=Qipengyuania citrea TaxID=225971 RepID=UPI00067EE361|nr:sensor histidine kinase [Qipengyuania citrea]